MIKEFAKDLWVKISLQMTFLLIFFISAIAISAANPGLELEVEVDMAFQTADRLQAENKIQEALTAYEGILKKYPDTNLKTEIMLRIAQCYSQLGDDDSAIRIYLKLVSEDPNSIEASQAVSLMFNLFSERYQFDEVMAISKQIAQQFPGTEAAAMAMYRAASYLYSREQYQDAIKEYENFINQFPKSIMASTAFNRLIYIYISQGMFKEAEARLAEKLAQNPLDTYLIRQMALVYQKQGKYDEALNIYQQLLAKNPNDFDIYEQLGALYAERGEKEKAIAEWSKITATSPGQYSRHEMLAYILKSHGFYDEAAAEYQKAIELQPMASYIYTQLADLYIIRRQFDSAVDVYLGALLKYPVDQPERGDLTAAMLELCDSEGLHDRVISRLKANISLSPGNIPALSTLADVYFHLGNFDESLKLFKTVSSFRLDQGEILFEHAQILKRERHFDHAIRFYQAALDLFPGSYISARALMDVGFLKSKLNQPESAIVSLQSLISHLKGTDPLWLSAYILIGDIYLQQLHDLQASFSKYSEAKRIIDAQADNSDNTALYQQLPDLYMRLAECYRLFGNYDEAEKILNVVQTRYTSRSMDAQVAKLLGDCYFSRGDFDKALTQYQKAAGWLMNEDWVNDSLDRIAMIREYSDRNAQAFLEVHSQIEILQKLGRYGEALSLCISAVKKYGPDDRTQLEIGHLLALQLQTKEAISAYEQLIQSKSPLAPDALFQIAELYAKQLNDRKQAIEKYSLLIQDYSSSVFVSEARNQIRQLSQEQIPANNIP